MPRIDPGGSGPYIGPASNGNPDGNIKVDTGVWHDASVAIQVNNNASADIAAAARTTLNGALDSLNVLSFIEGASELAQALDDFSNNIELTLACVGTDLLVVSSGLAAAAAAFGSLDRALVSTFSSLEAQMPYFTTATTLASNGAMPYSPLKIVGQPDGGVGLSISPDAAKALGITAAVGGAVVGGSLLVDFLTGLGIALAF